MHTPTPRKALAILAALLAALFASAAPSHAAGSKRFGQWVVGCDNARHCRAVGFPTTVDADEPTFLIVDREAGAEGRLRIGGGRGFLPHSEIFVDGKPVLKPEDEHFVDMRQPPDVDAIAPMPLTIVDGALNLRLLAAALNGATLAFEAAPSPQAVVPLDGLRAALLFMDEEQGRAGGPTALVARGARPASEVPPASPAPLAPPAAPPAPEAPADQAENRAVNAFHRANASRQLCDEKSFGEWELAPSRVSPRQRLYQFYCREEASHGSRFLYLVYIVDEDAPQRIAKALFERLDGTGAGLRLETDQLLRGGDMQDGNWVDHREGDRNGECRDVAAWRWDGKAFRLIMHVVAPVCESPLTPPTAIALWRTREN